MDNYKAFLVFLYHDYSYCCSTDVERDAVKRIACHVVDRHFTRGLPDLEVWIKQAVDYGVSRILRRVEFNHTPSGGWFQLVKGFHTQYHATPDTARQALILDIAREAISDHARHKHSLLAGRRAANQKAEIDAIEAWIPSIDPDTIKPTVNPRDTRGSSVTASDVLTMSTRDFNAFADKISGRKPLD